MVRMKKYCFSVGILLTFSFLSVILFPVYGSELSRKRGQLQDVRSEMKEKRQLIREYRAQEKDVLADLSELEEAIEQKEKQLEVLEGRIKRNQRDVEKADRELKESEEKLQQQLDLLNARLRDTYKNGDVSYLEVILGAEDFSDFIKRLDFLSLIIKQDAELVDAIELQKVEIEERKAALEIKRKEFLAAQTAAENKQRELEAQSAQKERILSRVREEKAAYEQALDELEQTSRELESVIRTLQARQSYRPPARPNSGVRQSNGRMVWPTAGRVTSPFGYRVHPIFGTVKLHTGIDIAAPNGTPIKAGDNGVIIFSGWMRGYGQVVIVDHGGGISTLYAHCSALLVGEGTNVERDQTIARVGSTGFSTGPHLHFEVRINGSPVNPLGWL